MTVQKRKLIEVAMPLEIINRECVREKSIRQGHPATLHLWWARRPLAACRAVLFAQLVDDPSSKTEKFPTVELQSEERQRLFRIIERLVSWDNINNAQLLAEAKREILESFEGKSPSVHDPFAGGGSIPLEAQRLGLNVFASDLNPVAVLLNKALMVLPPKYYDRKPVFPQASDKKLDWPGTSGLAEDVREYGNLLFNKAKEILTPHFPLVEIPDGSKSEVIAWIWARTVTCPNPACQVSMPLARSFWLKKDKKKPAWIKPVLIGGVFEFKIMHDSKGPEIEGTINRTGGICLACQTAVPLQYIKTQGKTNNMSVQLMAMVAVGNRERLYVAAGAKQISAAKVLAKEIKNEVYLSEELPNNPRDFNVKNYGLDTFRKLFTDRQTLALTTFSELVRLIGPIVTQDAIQAGFDRKSAEDYAGAITLYLSLAVGRCADYNSSICTWHINRETIRNTFARQSVPMTWDFAEANILGDATGNWNGQISWITKVIEKLPVGQSVNVIQGNATEVDYINNIVVSTDPPYYDNICYADLSDYFYVWIRNSAKYYYDDVLNTLMTPKADELVASAHRFDGSKKKAEEFFEHGFIETFSRIRKSHNINVPMTVFYAFKQTEEDTSGTASTGWETMLNAILTAGFTINATWPIRTELSNRMLGSGTNALASSIVLACRIKSENAEATTRRVFLSTLKQELPLALSQLQEGNVAPVDLAQAAIGPGMSVFSRFSKVVEADGSDMSVRTALALINQVLDEVLSEQEGDFDPETRFCIKWFSQFGWNPGVSGDADVLSRAVNTSISALERGGVFKAVAGKAQLIHPQEMTIDWDPKQDKTVSIWEVALRVAYVLQTDGLQKAAIWLVSASTRVDIDAVKELSYLLFSLSEKRGWSESAILFNSLGTSWSDMYSIMQQPPKAASEQIHLGFEKE